MERRKLTVWLDPADPAESNLLDQIDATKGQWKARGEWVRRTLIKGANRPKAKKIQKSPTESRVGDLSGVEGGGVSGETKVAQPKDVPGADAEFYKNLF